MTTDLCACTALEIADLVRTRRASCREVTDAVLARIERLNPRLNAFAALDAERAREQAGQRDEAIVLGDEVGPLHGVPVTIKDVQAVEGLPTRRGSRLSDPAAAAADSPAVARLRAAGAVILGKTTSTEHGWTAVSDSPLTGTTHNPWRHGHTSGGSSCGAAALAAAECGPLHLGTDGAGSVRLPAHFCGVVGHKPTYGTVPYVPVPNNGALSHIGPLARTVTDAELMLAVMSGAHPADHTTLPGPFRPAEARDDLRGIRIAYSPDLGHAKVDSEVAAIVADAVRVFADLGASVEETVPAWGPKGPALIRDLWVSAFAAFTPKNAEQEAAIDPGLLAAFRTGPRLSAAELQAAQGRRIAYAAEIGTWFESGPDLLVTPSASVATFPVGRQRPPDCEPHDWDWLVWAEFSYPFDLSHGPAVSVPCGLTRDGRPVGLQIAAGRLRDAAVLQAAKAFLAARPFTAKPDLAA